MNRNFSVDDLYEIIRFSNVEELSSREIAEKMGCEKTAILRFLRKEHYKEFWEEYDKKPHANAQTISPDKRRKTLKGKRFVFTVAQNNSFVHDKFLQSLKVFMQHNDATLVVGCTHYNKSGFQNLTKENDSDSWFDPKIKSYIKEESLLVAKDLVWCGELNISPTAVRPMSGFHNYTRNMSGIFPSNKVCLESMPTHIKEPCRMLYTTGTVTYPNYIQKKAGQKAEFHHVIGALYVEIDGDGDWFARHLIAETDTGCFYDLDHYYTPFGFEKRSGQSVEALNPGDLHVEMIDKDVALGAFGLEVIDRFDGEKMQRNFKLSEDQTIRDNCLIEFLKPKKIFAHDTSDFSPRNHHNINDPHFRFKVHKKKIESVEEGLRQCAEFLNGISRPYTETIVVESNHDIAFMRWLKTADYKTDPVNAVFFLESQLDMYKSIDIGDDEFNLFAHTLRKLEPEMWDKNVTFLNGSTNDSLKILDEDGNGIQCVYHGDKGPGGARGSIENFAKLGGRANIGHSHVCRIFEGVYQAGTFSILDPSYVCGAPSAWSHSAIITYTNGKRTIVTFRKSKWRAE